MCAVYNFYFSLSDLRHHVQMKLFAKQKQTDVENKRMDTKWAEGG